MNDALHSSRAILSRINWRFLLPAPGDEKYRHMVLLGGTDSMAELLQTTGIASHVSTTLPSDQSADLIACLYPMTPPLQAVADKLCPGGCLYLEGSRTSKRSLATTPGRTASDLRKMGIEPVETYLVSPNLEAGRVYIPARPPDALRWYVNSSYIASSPQKRIFESLLRVTTRLRGDWFAKIAPHFAIIAVKPGDARSHEPATLGRVRLVNHANGKRLHAVMLGDMRVVLLPFSTGPEPLAVIKVPPLPAFSARTETEHAALLKLQREIDPEFRAHIPQPLSLARFNGVSISAESYLAGTSLARRSGRWGMPAGQKIVDFELAAGWLTRFHERTAITRGTWDDNERQTWLETLLEEYSSIFSPTAPERELFQLARNRAEELIGSPCATVWQHRDFNVWNIFRSGNSINVIDWEGARPGPPLCDLIHFATHWHDAVRGYETNRQRQFGVYQLYCRPSEDDRLVAAVRASIEAYMKQSRLDERFFPLLLLYTWLELALRRHAQQRDLGDELDEPRRDNQYPMIVELLAAHRGHLFGDGTSP